MPTPREALARDVENVRFPPTRWREGYEMDAVDVFLDRSAEAVRTGVPVDAVVGGAHFPRVRLREGYDIEAVDEVLRRMVDRDRALDPWVEPPAESGPFAVLVERIERVRFNPVRRREGYDTGEVDELLDRMVAALRGGEPVRTIVDDARLSRVRFREGYTIAEVDDFLRSVVADSET